jgi:hypothetical protein
MTVDIRCLGGRRRTRCAMRCCSPLGKSDCIADAAAFIFLSERFPFSAFRLDSPFFDRLGDRTLVARSISNGTDRADAATSLGFSRPSSGRVLFRCAGAPDEYEPSMSLGSASSWLSMVSKTDRTRTRLCASSLLCRSVTARHETEPFVNDCFARTVLGFCREIFSRRNYFAYSMVKSIKIRVLYFRLSLFNVRSSRSLCRSLLFTCITHSSRSGLVGTFAPGQRRQVLRLAGRKYCYTY